MSVHQLAEKSASRFDWGSSLLVAVGPHVAFVVVAYVVCNCNSAFPVVLATFNVVVCLLVGALTNRAILFASASLSLALINWLLTCTNAPGPRLESVFPRESRAILLQTSPNPQP